MFRRLKRRSKSKQPVNEVSNSSGDHVQSPESQSGLPVRTIMSSETEVGNPRKAVPTTAKPNQLQHRPGQSNELGVVNTPGAGPTAVQQGPLPLEGAIPGVPTVKTMDEAVPSNAKPSRDLWEEAFKKLDEDKKDLLSKVETHQGSRVVEQVAEQTEQSYSEQAKRRWRISSDGGKPDFVFRDAFEKTLKFVLKFKGLISAGVGCDVTQHAAGPWAVISLGLQMVQNNVDMRKNLIEACATLTEALTRFAAYEASYRRPSVPYFENLEDTIVAAHVAILELSAEIVRVRDLNATKRILSSVILLNEQPLQEFVRTLGSKEETLRQWTHIIHDQSTDKKLQGIDENVASTLTGIEELATQVLNVAAKLLSEEELGILKWLSNYSFSDSHISAASKREPETGEWIFSVPEYKTWKTCDSGLMWLYAGCGKSILCSSIIDDLEKLCAPDSTSSGYALAYWYFTFRDRDSVDFNNLLCSLIRQLCAATQTLPNSVRDLWAKHSRAGSRPTRASLIETLDTVIVGLRTANQHALVVLDALDEYPLMAGQDSSERRDTLGREDVLHWLQEFCMKHSNVRFLALSRDEIDIRCAMHKAMKVDVERNVARDLDLFISKGIDRIVQKKRWIAPHRSELLSRFREYGERRFRWASLVLRRVSECKTPAKLQEALTKLPESLEAIYADVLTNKIPKDYIEQARLMLIWLSYSLRPLTLWELASVASLPEPQDVLDICTSSLVSLPREGGYLRTVQLDHFSVKEYLTSERLGASAETAYFHETPLMAHLIIAQTSVSHLIGTNQHDLRKRAAFESWCNKDRLLDYSTGWFQHIREADDIDINMPKSKEPKSEALRAECHKLFRPESNQSLLNWVLARPRSYKSVVSSRFIQFPRRQISPMLVACLLDMPDNVQRLLDNGANVDHDVIYFGFPEKLITAAAIEGSLKVVKLLLENNASLVQSELNYFASRSQRHGVAILSTILEARKYLKIENDTVIGSAQNYSKYEILKYILGARDFVTIDETLLVAIVKKCIIPDDETVEKMLSRGKDLRCDSKWMLELFLRTSDCGRNIKIVIDSCGTPDSMRQMSQDIVGWVIDNQNAGDEMLPVVLEYYEDMGIKFQFGPDMLRAVIHAPYISSLIRTILSHAKEVVITKNILDSITTQKNHDGHTIMSMFMKHETCGAKNFESDKDFGFPSDLNSHLRECPINVSQKLLQAACRWDSSAIGWLQAHARPNVTFIETIAGEAPFDSVDTDDLDTS